MWRVYTSRWINHRLCGGRKGEMLSTRCHREQRVLLVQVIDWSFFIIRGEINHCANSEVIDAQTQQSSTGKAEDTAVSP